MHPGGRPVDLVVLAEKGCHSVRIVVHQDVDHGQVGDEREIPLAVGNGAHAVEEQADSPGREGFLVVELDPPVGIDVFARAHAHADGQYAFLGF